MCHSPLLWNEAGVTMRFSRNQESTQASTARTFHCSSRQTPAARNKEGVAEGVALSVIIPVCNVENYLADCLDSALRQSFQDVEIICINDGSTDGSLEILRKYEKQDSRVKVIDKQNAGYGAAMNDGLDAATGTYIGILESDDYVCEHAWTKLFELATQNNLDVAKGCYLQFSSTEESFLNVMEQVARHCPASLPSIPVDTVFNPKDYQRCFWTNPSIWTAIYKREFLAANNIRFNETPGASYQDTSFAFKVWVSATRVMAAEFPVIHYRLDSAFSSSNSRAKAFAVCDEMDECEAFLNNRAADSVFYDILCAIRYKTYLWNIGRVGSSLKRPFFKRMQSDFRRDFELGRLNTRFVPGSYYDEFLAIAGIPDNNLDADTQPTQADTMKVLLRSNSSEVNTPRFTLVVPFTNDEQYLPDFLKSIELQSCKDFETIFVDTGSSDNSFKLISEFASDHRSTVLRYHSATMYEALECAAAEAQGTFIQLILPCDRLKQQALAMVSDQARNLDLDLVVHGISVYHENQFSEEKQRANGNPYARYRTFPLATKGALLFAEIEEAEGYIPELWSMAFAKNLLKQMESSSNFTDLSSQILSLRLLLSATRAGHLNQDSYVRKIADRTANRPNGRVENILSRLANMQTLQELLSEYEDDYIVWHALDLFDAEWARQCRIEYRKASSAQRIDVSRQCSRQMRHFLIAVRWGVRPDELRISYERRGNRLQRELNKAENGGRAVRFARKLSEKARILRASASRSAKAGNERLQGTGRNEESFNPRALIVFDSAEASPETLSYVIVAKVLAELGESVSATIPCKGPLEIALNTVRIPYRVFPMFDTAKASERTSSNRLILDNRTRKKFEAFVKSGEFDLIHCLNCDAFYGVFAAEAAGIPSILHLRTSDDESTLGSDLVRNALRHANSLCVSSAIAADDVLELVPNRQAQIIHDGAEPLKFYIPRTSMEFDPIRAVLCVESLTPDTVQDLRNALCAFGELDRERPGIVQSISIIAGQLSENALPQLHSSINDYGLSELTGIFGSRDDMPELWHHSNLGLMLSSKDFSAYMGIGAMMTGVPLICSSSNPCSEIIENDKTGFIVIDPTGSSIKAAIIKVIDQPALSLRIAIEAQQFARFCYPLKESAYAIYQLHKDILREFKSHE